jgi:hypothetical protein
MRQRQFACSGFTSSFAGKYSALRASGLRPKTARPASATASRAASPKTSGQRRVVGTGRAAAGFAETDLGRVSL